MLSCFFSAGRGESAIRIKEITDVISSDLQSSGQFKPLSLSDVKEFPSQQTEVNTSYWKAQGIEDLVIGTVQKNGSNYTVHFTLLDMVKKTSDAQAQVLLDMQFSNIAANKLRALAHHISDLIFQKLIGVRGIFSTRIAYISVLQDGRNRRYVLEVADSDGHNPRVLYRSDYILMSPAWSPDARRIAFVSYEKERASVNVVDLTTGKIERITQFPGMNNAPTFSPDGRSLALVLSKDGSPKIYTVDLASKKLKKVTDGPGADTEPCRP